MQDTFHTSKKKIGHAKPTAGRGGGGGGGRKGEGRGGEGRGGEGRGGEGTPSVANHARI